MVEKTPGQRIASAVLEEIAPRVAQWNGPVDLSALASAVDAECRAVELALVERIAASLEEGDFIGMNRQVVMHIRREFGGKP
jgi:hypothetical protein